MSSKVNRAVRRQKQLAAEKLLEASEKAKIFEVSAKTKVSDAAARSKRTANEFFLGSIINMGFGVFGVGVLPLIAHWIVASTIDDASPHLQQDAYLLALVLWGNTFYEVRCSSDGGTLLKKWLRLYTLGIHWFSLIFMGGMAYAYALIVAKPNSSSSHALENGWLLGVLLVVAAAGYLIFKIPVLEAEAAEKAGKE